MPSRSQEYVDPTQATSSSSQDTERRLPTRQPSLTTRLSSNSTLQLTPDNSNMGLATYSHDRNNELVTRSFLFRDEQVHSLGFSSGYPSGGDRDHQSNSTSFDGLDSVQSPDHITHCYRDTYIDRSAQVFNGDIARAYDSSSTREHHLHGGSVKNNSRLVNGDLDRETFLAFFCNSDDRARQGGERRGGTRHRRRGPRAEGRTGSHTELDLPSYRPTPRA